MGSLESALDRGESVSLVERGQNASSLEPVVGGKRFEDLNAPLEVNLNVERRDKLQRGWSSGASRGVREEGEGGGGGEGLGRVGMTETLHSRRRCTQG